MRVNEIFRSIDGEVCGVVKKNYLTSPVGGQGGWTIFIRFQGCNLRCSYCDTPNALTKEGGKEYTVDEIIEEVLLVSKESTINKVTITGGEPLLQNKQELVDLCKKLYAKGFFISLETNGTIVPFKNLRYYIYSFVIDIKDPSSGMEGTHRDINEFSFWKYFLRADDYIKFVVSTNEDIRFAIQKKNELNKVNCTARLAISPAMPGMKPIDLINILDRNHEYDFQINLQLHKLIGAK